MELATLWEQQLENHEEAVAVLEEVLRLDPGRADALAQIARIYRALERWRAATNSLERLVRASEDPALVRQANLQRAELLEKELGEDEKALEAVLAVLEKDPDDREALEASARLHQRLGRWDGTADALNRLAEKAPPAERARILLELADISERSLGKQTEAEEHMARAAALCSLAPTAVMHLERYFAERQDYEGLDLIMGRVLKGAPAQSQGIVPLRLARARNLTQNLGRHDDAEKEIRQALTEDPNSIDALLALGALHLQRSNPALAQVEYHGVLERDPFQLEAYRGLRRVFASKREKDRARLAAQVLVTLGSTDAEEQQAAASVPPPVQAPPPETPLGLEGYLQLMATRDDVPPAARQLLSVLTPHLHLVFPSNEERWGITPGDDLPGGHPLKTRVQAIAALLGVDATYRVALTTTRPAEFALEQGPTPVIIVGQQLFANPDRRLDFLLGRALGRILARTVYLSNANLRDLEVTLAGVAAQYDRNFGLHLGGDEDLQAVGRSFLRQLGRKHRRLIEEPARDYASTDPVGMHAWAEAASQGAARCGLLACADLVATAGVLREEKVSQDDLAGLCIFNISPRYAEARKRLGLADL
jgi:tetratricopeptide (TPR) repeat protein